MVQQKPSQQHSSLQDHLNGLQQLISRLPKTTEAAQQLVQAFEEMQAAILPLKMVEERQHQTELAFRAAIEEAVSEGIMAVDLTGQQTYANAKFCQMVGWDATELVGAMPPFLFWPIHKVKSISEVFQTILMGTFPRQGVELSFQRQNGEEFQAHLLASSQLGPEGKIIGWVISVHDVTADQQTEEILRQSEARFQRLISNIPGMVYRYFPCADGSDVFKYVNAGSRDLLEIDPDVVLGDPSSLWSLIHPEDMQSLQTSIAIAVEQSLPWKWEGRIITPSGQMKWIQGSSRPDNTNYGEVWDGLLIDITDRKQTEEQLKASLQEKEVLIQEINHRVKNNLQIVSSLLDLQASQLIDPEAQKALSNSRSRIESMALVHDSLYRSENLAEISFAEYVQTQIMHLFQAYNVKPEDLTLNVRIDPDLALNLEQAIPCGLILNELITNALRHGFSPNSKGEIFVQATIPTKHVMTLTVGNSGDRLPEGFDLENVQSMGLRLVTTLVKQLKGAISLRRGAYTEFIVTLPYANSL